MRDRLLDALVDCKPGQDKKYRPTLSRKDRDRLIEMMIREQLLADRRAASEFKQREGFAR